MGTTSSRPPERLSTARFAAVAVVVLVAVWLLAAAMRPLFEPVPPAPVVQSGPLVGTASDVGQSSFEQVTTGA